MILLFAALAVFAAILIGLGAFTVAPTLRFAVALGVCAFLALGIPRVAIVAGGVIVLAFVVDAVLVRRRPDVERTVANVIVRGLPSPLTVDGDAPGALEIRQPMPPAAVVTPETGPAPYDGKITALRRGRMTLPPVATRVTGPLGLAALVRTVGESREVLVYPDVPRARDLALRVRQGRFADAGLRTRGPLGLGTDFESIRDYLPDDDIRQINWPATQRMERPMSNVFRIEQDRDVICVVDAGRLMAAPVGNGTNLDVAVDAAVSVALVADVVGDRCGLVAFDGEIRRHLTPGRSGGDAVVRALVDLEPGESDSDYELAFRTIGRGKRAFVLVLTDLLDESAAASLLEAMPVLVRRHAVAVASARDAEVDRLLRTPPEAARDVYTASAAVHVLDARAVVTAQLRRLGADVVEAPAELLGRASVAAYLRAKQRARL